MVNIEDGAASSPAARPTGASGGRGAGRGSRAPAWPSGPRLGVAALAAVAFAGSAGVESAAAGGNSTTWSCTSTATACSFTVPSDVYGTASIVVDGGQGGSFGGSEIGGDGAAISATYALPPGATVTAYVGGSGSGPSGGNPGSGGAVPSGAPAGLAGGSGGRSQYDGGSGGGSSSALYVNGTLLVVAGGGGGAGGEGVDDPTPIPYGGEGGTPFVDGGDGSAGGGCNGGSQGGAGGANGTGGAGSPGASGSGCAGISTTAGATGGNWGVGGGGSGGEAPNSDGNGHAGGGGGGGGGGYGAGGGAGAASGAGSAGGGGAGASFVSSSLSDVSESGTNSGSGSVTITYSTGTAPLITSPLSASASAGSAISIQLQASGEPTPTFSATGALPAGITLSSAGLLSGTLGGGSAGTWPVALTATNSVSSSTVTYTLTVTEPPSYTGATAVVAGTGTAGTSINGTPAASAALDDPSDVLVDTAGDRFVLNSGSSTVYEIPAANTSAYGITMTAGDVYDIAGTGSAGDSGDSGPGHLAKLDHPQAIALDSAGDLLIADTGNATIRVLAATSGCLFGEQISVGDIYTVIGTPGSPGYYGDGGSATGAELDAPTGVAVHGSDVFVADSGNNVIREVGGITSCTTVPDIDTIAGTDSPGTFTSGAAASTSALDDPTSLAVGPDANLYLDDAGADVLAALATSSGTILGQGVTAGHLYALAGNGTAGTAGNGGSASTAEVDEPGGIALDAAGNLYLTDPSAGDLRVVAASGTSSLFGIPTSTGDIYQLASGLTDPLGIALDPSGALYLAEGSAEDLGVLGIAPEITSASSDSMQAGVASSFTFTASGEPRSDFTESGPLPSGVILSTSGVLSGTPALGSAGSYPLTVRASNGVGAVAPQDFGLTVTAATTKLGFSLDPANPLVAGTATLVVTVSPTPDTGTTVSVSDAKGWFDCTAAPVSTTSGSASCTSSTLTSTATDQLTVSFNGDTQYASASGSTSVTPGQAPTKVTLSADPATPSALSTTTLTATVSPTPDGGDVAFSDGDSYVSSCGDEPVVDGAASCPTATLAAPGVDTFSATYLGDTDYEKSPTAELPLTIARAVTTLEITTDPSPLLDEEPGALIATVSGPNGPVDGGSVGFSDTAGNISSGSCPAEAVSSSTGRAICNLALVAASSDTVTAAYSGDSLYAPVAVNESVSPSTRPTTIKLSVVSAAFVVGQSSVLTATVDQPGATGTVTFSDSAGLVDCPDVSLQVSGTATCTASAPSASGSDSVTASYSGDANDAAVSTTAALAIDTEPAITSATSYTTSAGATFSATIDTTGLPSVSAISLDGGSLPPGLSLVDSGNGSAAISGSIAADAGGLYSAGIALSDGVLAPVVEQLSITVDESPSFTTISSGSCVAGAPCDISLSAVGYPAPTISVATTLPSGLSFADQGGGTALISGTPTAADVGTTSFAISAANGIGTDVVQHFTLAITPSPAAPGGGSPGGGSSGSGGSGSSSPSGSGSAPAGSGSSGSGTSSSSSTRTPTVVISSYDLTARLSGALSQHLVCPASTAEIHSVTSSNKTLTDIGFDVPCKDGALAAVLSGSVTARRATTKVRSGNKTLTRTTTLWQGGFSLAETKRHLALTFAVERATVNRELAITLTGNAVVVENHADHQEHLTIRIAPQYSSS